MKSTLEQKTREMLQPPALKQGRIILVEKYIDLRRITCFLAALNGLDRSNRYCQYNAVDPSLYCLFRHLSNL